VVHPHAAGIDIGNASHYVAVPPSRDPQPVRCFGCTTAELKKMAEWLTQCRIRTVALQSTGVYWIDWIAVYDILEEAGLEVYLVNARESEIRFARRRRFAPCGHTGDSARIWYAVSVVIFSGCRRH
jgi:transposase